jgi:hypothetical protein
MIRNNNLAKERMKLLVCTTPIDLDSKSILVKQSFNKDLKFLELLKDFKFIFEQIDRS